MTYLCLPISNAQALKTWEVLTMLILFEDTWIDLHFLKLLCLLSSQIDTNIWITHYSDVIIGPMASQITILTIVYSIVYSGGDQRKLQCSASLAFVRGNHRGPVNSPHKWPVTRKMFPFDDVIMHAEFIGGHINRFALSKTSLPSLFSNWYEHLNYPLQWRHNRPYGVSNHHPHDCLLNRLFRRRSKKTSMLSVTGLCEGKSPGTGEFPAQMASNAENVSIWWRHHACWIYWRTHKINLHFLKLLCLLSFQIDTTIFTNDLAPSRPPLPPA